MRAWELTRYAVENVYRSPLRSLLTIAGIAIASGALVSMVGFVLGLREQVELPIRRLGMLSNIEVKPSKLTSETGPILNQEAIDQFEKINEVAFVYPDFRLTEVGIRRETHEAKTFAIGVPREAGLIGFSKELLVAGDFFSIGDASEAVIGEALVDRLGFETPLAAIGQEIVLTVGGLVTKGQQQFQYDAEELTLLVTGVFAPPGFATSFAADSVLLPVDLMRKMPASWMEHGLRQLSTQGKVAEGYVRVIVRAESPAAVIRVERKIRDLGFSTLSVIDRMEDMKRFFVFMEVLLTAVGTVALVVAGLGILNTLTMTVLERFQEIGIYKAVGASRGDIRLMFLVEAGVVGLLGGLSGLVLAGVVSQILGVAFNAYAASQGVDGPQAIFRFPLWLLVCAVAYAVLISIVSGLYPAMRAAAVDPIEALRRG